MDHPLFETSRYLYERYLSGTAACSNLSIKKRQIHRNFKDRLNDGARSEVASAANKW